MLQERLLMAAVSVRDDCLRFSLVDAQIRFLIKVLIYERGYGIVLQIRHYPSRVKSNKMLACEQMKM